MKLKIGNAAPHFKAEALTGKMVSLNDYRNKNLLIKFYRFATCPICNLHLRNFVRRFDDVQRHGLSVLCVFHSPISSMEKNLAATLPFELLSDPQKKIFQSYGVQSSWSGMFAWDVMRDYFLAMKAGFSSGMLSHDGGVKGHPADFIIDKDGRIVYTHYGRNYADSLSVDQVITISKELKLNVKHPSPVLSVAGHMAI
jgi:peroxiredoxin